jgi:hypothetical protein
MLNNQGASQKHNCKITLPGTTGVKGDEKYTCHIETKLRTEVTGVGGANTVLVQGSIIGSSQWTTITTITGATSAVSDISTYDFVRYSVGVANGTGEIVSSGFLSFI